jgi:hypothetical protein
VTFGETGRTGWAVAGLCGLLLALGLRLGAVRGPFNPPLDDPVVGPAIAARYHAEFGFMVTFALPVRFVAPGDGGPGATRFDLSRPIGGPLYLSGWFSVFGIGPVAARTAGLVFWLLGLAALFHLVWRLYGPLTAGTMLLFVALSPAGVILGVRAGPAQASLGLCLVTLWAYLTWVDKRQDMFKVAMWFAYGLAVALDWSALVLAVIIPIHYLRSVSRAWRYWPPILVFPGLAVVYLGLHLLFTQLALARIIGPDTFLSAWRAQLAVNPVQWPVSLWRAAWHWLTLPLVGLGLAWVYTRLFPARYPDLVHPPRVTELILDPRIPIRPRTGLLWMLLALALIPPVLAPVWAIQQPQAWWPLIFFLSLAAARALDDLAVRFDRLQPRATLRISVMVVVAAWAAVQLFLVWPARGTEARDLGRFLAAQTSPGRIIAAVCPHTDPAVEYYARRQIRRLPPGRDGSSLIKDRRITRLVARKTRIKNGTWLDHLARTHVTKTQGPWVVVFLDKKLPPPAAAPRPVRKVLKKPAPPVRAVAPPRPHPGVKPSPGAKPGLKPPVKPAPAKPGPKPAPQPSPKIDI